MRSRVAIAADSHHGARPAHNAQATIKLLRTILQRNAYLNAPLTFYQNGESKIAKTKTDTNPNKDTSTDKNTGTNTKTKTYDV